VEFRDGVPDITQIPEGSLVILDDLLHEIDARVEKLFTKYCHHKTISVMFLTQNFFYKTCRTITLNASYIVLFKNSRDSMQITCLARQMNPSKPRFLVDAFKDATAKPYSYLVLDLRADTPDEYRVRSQVFPHEENYVYVPK
jgi:hypothetical protein